MSERIPAQEYSFREKIEETVDFALIRASRKGDGMPVSLKLLRAEGLDRSPSTGCCST